MPKPLKELLGPAYVRVETVDENEPFFENVNEMARRLWALDEWAETTKEGAAAAQVRRILDGETP